ncbi:MAG TPA: S41 family peptidase [Pirellulales bacterium]|nr:S41 family peptidase [Pirellulales bacterium]
MPRRNILLLTAAVVVSVICYFKADSAHRSRYGRMFDTFVDILETVEARYIEPVEDRTLFESALRGMVAGLGDPNSAYYDPGEAQRSRAQLDQQFAGIGIELIVDPKSRLLTVVTPLINSPAAAAGVMPGDSIVEIDGEAIEQVSLDQVAQKLRGKPGTRVHLKLLRESSGQPIDVTIERALIKTETVVGYQRSPDGKWNYALPQAPDVVYARVTLFGKNTGDELKAFLAAVLPTNPQGIVLDLRNNGGGLLQAADDAVNLFIHDGVIVSTRGRDHQELDVRMADGTGPVTRLPLAILINGLSASASEIVAACLQDHQRATIVGTRSFGKGTVQDLILLEDGHSELRLTIATYWRPSGKNIHRTRGAKANDDWGVLPSPGFDVPIEEPTWSELLRDRQRREAIVVAGRQPAAQTSQAADTQLAAAIDALRRAK